MLRRTSNLSRRRSNIGPGWPAVALAVACAVTVPQAGGQWAGTRVAKAPPNDAALLEIVRDRRASGAARLDAACRLLELPPANDALAAISAAISDPGEEGVTKAILLDAIARTAATPPALFDPVARLVAAAGNEDLPFIAPALGSFRTRESARLLLGLTAPARPVPVRAAAFAALARLSGRADLGQDAEAWQRWLDGVSILSEAEWREQLARDQASRADRLSAMLQTTQQELAPIYRRLYGQLPPSERPRLLAEMLKDEREELRTLGFQLAGLELSAGQKLPLEVSDAAVLLLADPSAQTRARAAVLLDQVAREEASAAIVDALNRETDPMAASAMLSAAARWPSPEARASILSWLRPQSTTRAAAAKAALALVRAGMLNTAADRAQAAASLRAIPFEQLGTSELRLLVIIGTDEDRGKVADMLNSASPPARLAAAAALAEQPDFLPRILDAAARDSDLFATAAESAAGVPTVATYRAVAALRAPDADSRRAGLQLVARSLSAADLLTVVRETDDPQFAATLLDRLPDLATSTDAAGAGSVALAMALLAELRLELGQPDRALTALDMLETLRSRFPLLPEDQAPDLRVAAYLCLDRTDRAVAVGGGPAGWLRGLRLIKSQPQARAAIVEIRARFAGRMTPDQLVEFALLESQVAAREEEEKSRLVGPPEPVGR